MPSDAPTTPRAVVVHGRAHVAFAARLAVELGVPVMLITAPGAADYVGPDILLAMIRQGLAEAPGADAVAVIDCADAAGRAQAALRAGWKHVIFAGHTGAARRLADLAATMGATITATRPAALDLIDLPDPASALRAWLTR